MTDSNWIEHTREKFFGSLANYLDKGYRFVRIKPNPTSE